MANLHRITFPDGNGHISSAVVSDNTFQKIQECTKEGADIILNANYKFTGRKGGYQVVKQLCRTNSKFHGYPKHIVWACYKNENAMYKVLQ
jgi:hypothetical protein